MNLNHHVRRSVLAIIIAGSIASAVGFAGAARADVEVPQDPPVAETPTDSTAEQSPPATVDGVEADDGADSAATSTTLPPATTTEPIVAPPTTVDQAEP